MRRLLLVTATATVLLLAGCTGGDGSEPGAQPGSTDGSDAATSEAPTPDAPAGPDCDAIWQAGSTLPADYTSCVADGEDATQDVVACLDGSSLVVYLDSFYAVTGQEIVKPDVAPLQDTDEFGAAYSACTGE
jgi:hypothetical protein